METKFLLGDLVITDGARQLLKRVPLDLVARHAVLEHGIITKREAASNARGLLTRGPIRSRYRADPTNLKSRYVVVDTNELWTSTLVSVSGEFD